MLIVNVASECGFTDGHYKAMVHLQKTLSVNDKFTVLAFPCNQFGGQEPGVCVTIITCKLYQSGVMLTVCVTIINCTSTSLGYVLRSVITRVPYMLYWSGYTCTCCNHYLLGFERSSPLC